MATYHGGDGGNEDPHNPWWKISFGCKGDKSRRKGKGRGPCQNLNLEAEFAKHGRLSLEFDSTKLNTWQAIGEASDMYKSLIGTLVRHIPQTYDSWEQVPYALKDRIIPALNTRFKLDHFIEISNPRDPIRQRFEAMVDRDCADQYRLRKSQFKRAHFSTKGGLKAVSQLEQAVPPEGMSQEDWRALLEYYQREDRVQVSARNSTNRSKQVVVGTHGRKNYSQYVHQQKVQANEDVNLVDLYERKHRKKKNNEWEHPQAEAIHAQLKQKKEEAEQNPIPTPQTDIVMDVRGTRPGHRRGIGRVIGNMGTQPIDYAHLTQGQGAQPYESGSSQFHQAQPSHFHDASNSQAGIQFDLNDPPQTSPYEPSPSSLFESFFNYDQYAQTSHYSGGSYHVNLDSDEDVDDDNQS